jgi:tRNA dimethylallyltransferase
MNAFADERGAAALHERLRIADPEAAAVIHPNNVRRVVRALEKAQTAGGARAAGQSLFNGEPLYDLAWVGLTMDRKDLYRRIDARVDEMMNRGLIEEVRGLASTLRHDSAAFQALGYKELLEYLGGKTTLESAVEQIKAGTRNYAKRQMTWFKRENSLRWFDTGTFENTEALDAAVFGYIGNTLHMSGI